MIPFSDPVSTNCCVEATGTTRRSVLRTSMALGGALAVTRIFGESLLQASFAGTTGGNVLVVLSLRGGVDGLGLVVPHGDPNYYLARPSTGIPAGALVCADSMFGLHPRMSALKPLWDAGELAAINATGLARPNRSHFAAIEAIEDADPGSSVRTGWINRMVGLTPEPTPIDAVQMGTSFPSAALSGPANVLAASDLSHMQLPGLQHYGTQRLHSMATSWAHAENPLARGLAAAVSISQGPARVLDATEASSVAYPTGGSSGAFAPALKDAAKLIRADLGTDVIAIDAGNWDLHTNYGTPTAGLMQSNVAGLADSLAAFFTDIGDLARRVTLVTISEFGRRVAENGSQGFDHGWGNVMLVAGAGVVGGRYFGRWPGLDSSSTEAGDLTVTTDYRDVLGEVITKRFPNRSLTTVFPGHVFRPVGFMA